MVPNWTSPLESFNYVTLICFIHLFYLCRLVVLSRLIPRAGTSPEPSRQLVLAASASARSGRIS